MIVTHDNYNCVEHIFIQLKPNIFCCTDLTIIKLNSYSLLASNKPYAIHQVFYGKELNLITQVKY